MIIFNITPLLSGEFHYYIHDHLGNTRVVVDENGDVEETYDYYPFGMVLRRTLSEPIGTIDTFTGKELDEEGDLAWYYFGARYYDPRIARWMVVDPMAEKYPGVGPYVYCGNNPLIFIDVNGDSIQINDTMLENEAFANYLSTETGYNQAAQFAYKGQAITITGKPFEFSKDGKYSKQNVNFAGISENGAHTVACNSFGGKDYVGQDGIQTYNIYISDNPKEGYQADDIFHEMQHAEMFAALNIIGKLDIEKVNYLHHFIMYKDSWDIHDTFIKQHNALYNNIIGPQRNFTPINSNEIKRYLYNQMMGDYGTLMRRKK